MEDNKYTHENVLIHPKAAGNIISESDRMIANCNCVTSNVRDEISVNHANAERIIKCWNEYDKLKEERDLLIEALKNIDNWYDSHTIAAYHSKDIFESAKELLTTIKK